MKYKVQSLKQTKEQSEAGADMGGYYTDIIIHDSGYTKYIKELNMVGD